MKKLFLFLPLLFVVHLIHAQTWDWGGPLDPLQAKFQIQQYRLELEIFPETQSIAGQSTITFSSNEKLAILKENKDNLKLQNILKMTYDKVSYNYYITPKTLMLEGRDNFLNTWTEFDNSVARWMFKDMNGFVISDLTIQESHILNLEKLHFAALININKWKNNNDSSAYISFLKGAGRQDITGYFKKFLRRRSKPWTNLNTVPPDT